VNRIIRAHSPRVSPRLTILRMMPLVRRFLCLQSAMLWQGGFLFYALVVVPIGTEHLGSAREQGLITQRVTVWLNLIGIGSLALALWTILAEPAPRRARLFVWALLGILHCALMVLHPYLGRGIDDDGRLISRPHFQFWHGTYLWITAVQWVLSLVGTVLLLRRPQLSEAPATSPR
ncbi:MAG: hypothetical protein ACRCZF_07625, partial [Gemmataceae bacterium]